MKEKELKPCPCCGGEAELCRNFGRIGISCKECGINIRSEELCSEIGYDSVYAEWNTRPSQDMKEKEFKPDYPKNINDALKMMDTALAENEPHIHDQYTAGNSQGMKFCKGLIKDAVANTLPVQDSEVAEFVAKWTQPDGKVSNTMIEAISIIKQQQRKIEGMKA
jgi:hypothetical protein